MNRGEAFIHEYNFETFKKAKAKIYEGCLLVALNTLLKQ